MSEKDFEIIGDGIYKDLQTNICKKCSKKWKDYIRKDYCSDCEEARRRWPECVEYWLKVKLRVPQRVSKGHLEFIFRDFNSEWDETIEVLEQTVDVANSKLDGIK